MLYYITFQTILNIVTNTQLLNCDILCFCLSESSQAENCTSLLVRHACCGGNQACQFLYNRAKTNILQFILRNSVYNLCQYAGVYLCF